MRLGIHLGTTYSLVARVDSQGTPVLIADYREPDRFRTRSLVYIGPEGALVGQAVEELLEDRPELPVARAVNLRLGSSETILTDHRGGLWRPEGVAALMLKKLRRDVQAARDDPVERVTLSVPPQASDPQRRSTSSAGRLAGFEAVDLVEEPLAVAAHYGTTGAGPGRTVLVYHMGGETFDATVLEAGDDGLFPLATEGARDLGGKDFDEAVMDLIAEQSPPPHPLDPVQPLPALRRHHRRIESIKLELGVPGGAEVRTALLLGGWVQEVVLTRRQFDLRAAILIERSLSLCEAALRAAGKTWADVDRVLLAGGASQLSGILEGLRRRLGKPPDIVRCHQPHLAVAYGTALLASRDAAPRVPGPAPRGGIAGMDLGFRVLHPGTGETTVDVMIGRNTPTPVQHTRVYYSNRPDQARLVFDVVQVPNRGAAVSLGHFAFPLERPRKNHPVEITLGYDDRGLVTAAGRDPDNGRLIRQEFGVSADDENRTAEQARLLGDVNLCEF